MRPFLLNQIWLFIPLVAVLHGCATAAKIDEMVPTTSVAADSDSKFYKSIFVSSASGGDETNPLWTSEISADDFKKALEIALQNAGFLSDLRSSGAYEIQVFLDEVQQPIAGIDMTVTTQVTYQVINFDTRERIFDKQITAAYTAEFSDAFMGVERLRLANEGAAEKNISQFLSELIELGKE
jgi:vesicle coat complex subunit